MEKRPVKVFSHSDDSCFDNERKCLYEGLFHQWGIDYEELEGGPVSYTSAVIEKPDGSMALVYPAFLKFTDVSEKVK